MTYETIKQVGRKYLAPALIGASLILSSGYDARAEQVETSQPAGIERVVENEKVVKNTIFDVTGFLVLSGIVFGLNEYLTTRG